jgi:hypothetical protein
MCQIDQTGLYVAIFRRAGRGELIFGFPTIAGLRDSLGVCPLRYDESVTVYRLEQADGAGRRLDPSEWMSES